MVVRMKGCSVLLLSLTLSGCGVQWALGAGRANVHRIGEERASFWQVVRDFHHRDGAMITSAVRLDDGSWVVSGGAYGARVMGIASEGTVRWQRDASLRLYRGASGALLGVGTLGGSESQRIEIVRLTHEGRTQWAIEAAVQGGGDVSIVELGGTLVVGYRGVLQAVDLEGRARWTHREEEGTTLLELARAGDVLFVAGALEIAPAESRLDCFARILDPETGEVLRERVIPSLGTACRVERSATHRGRAVLVLSDTYRQPTGTSGTSRMVILNLEHLTVEHDNARWPLQTDLAITPIPTLDVEETVFVDQYVAPPPDLGFTIVDVVSGRARRSAIFSMVPLHGSAGTMDGYMQLSQASTDGDEVILAGHFIGRVATPYGPLASDVRLIDGCAARDHIECFGHLPPVWATPAAGFFGWIRFEHAPSARFPR